MNKLYGAASVNGTKETAESINTISKFSAPTIAFLAF